MNLIRSNPALAGWLSNLRARAGIILLVVIALTLVMAFEDLHAGLMAFLTPLKSLIRSQPFLGGIAFVLFAALSAMVAFVSSAVIVPIGVYVWGKNSTLFLLWLGWIIGGACAYLLTRYFGRAVVSALGLRPVIGRYEKLLTDRTPFGVVLLFQLALPSELPGYLLGLARYPLWKYLAALALAELPYAILTIYLGASFVERQVSWLVPLGALVVAFSAWAFYRLHHHASA